MFFFNFVFYHENKKAINKHYELKKNYEKGKPNLFYFKLWKGLPVLSISEYKMHIYHKIYHKYCTTFQIMINECEFIVLIFAQSWPIDPAI